MGCRESQAGSLVWDAENPSPKNAGSALLQKPTYLPSLVSDLVAKPPSAQGSIPPAVGVGMSHVRNWVVAFFLWLPIPPTMPCVDHPPPEKHDRLGLLLEWREPETGRGPMRSSKGPKREAKLPLLCGWEDPSYLSAPGAEGSVSAREPATVNGFDRYRASHQECMKCDIH